MPRAAVQDNNRMSLRVTPEEKEVLMRAAALLHTNLTDFIIRNTVSAARKVIEENERIALSARDSLQVLDLLESPPAPNGKLLAAAFALPK